jgi:hypothetical protein
MKLAAFALMAVASAALADQPVTITAKVGQRVTTTVPAQQTVVLECAPADGTVAGVIGLDGVQRINARIEAMNAESQAKHK